MEDTATPAAGFDVDLSKRTGDIRIDLDKHEDRATKVIPWDSNELTVYEVPIPKIWLWPDNHNEMDEKTFRGECESMLIHDFIDPILLRPFDGDDIEKGIGAVGDHEMVDGEHRLRSVTTWIENGFPEGRAVPPVLRRLVQRVALPAFIVPMSRAQAKRVRIAISELHGKKNYLKLGRLVSDLSKTVSAEELRIGTPWTVDQLKEMVEVGRFDWEGYEKSGRQDIDKDQLDDGIFKLGLEVPRGQREQVYAALAELQQKYGVRFKETKRGKKKKKQE